MIRLQIAPRRRKSVRQEMIQLEDIMTAIRRAEKRFVCQDGWEVTVLKVCHIRHGTELLMMLVGQITARSINTHPTRMLEHGYGAARLRRGTVTSLNGHGAAWSRHGHGLARHGHGTTRS